MTGVLDRIRIVPAKYWYPDDTDPDEDWEYVCWDGHAIVGIERSIDHENAPGEWTVVYGPDMEDYEYFNDRESAESWAVENLRHLHEMTGSSELFL